jgi:hypothetical protein
MHGPVFVRGQAFYFTIRYFYAYSFLLPLAKNSISTTNKATNTLPENP